MAEAHDSQGIPVLDSTDLPMALDRGDGLGRIAGSRSGGAE